MVTTNKHILNWVDEMAALCTPDKIVWIDGSEEQAEALRAEACSTGEMIKLNPEKLPGCYLHRTAVNDVARVEGRTFICTSKKEDAGNINNWMDPKECYEKLTKLYRGSMKGRTMYVIPYSMGIVGSDFAKYGIELTDSIYVVLNMLIMTRVGTNVLEAIGDSADYIKGLHSKANLDEENRYICHFPEDNTIWSINSGYGGNVLLGKKCFALRIASYLGRKEGWMAEHMLILGIEYPNGEVKYVTAAFPSACGKTNLAMLIPPEIFRKQGYKAWCVGDDIAWLRIGPDGRLWAVNPKTDSSALLPAQTKSPTRTLSTPARRIQSSQTFARTSTTTLFGGKVSTTTRRRTLSTGAAKSGITQSTTRTTRSRLPALIRTQDSPQSPPTAPASPRNSTIPQVFRFPQLSLADVVLRPLPWFTSQHHGSTAHSSAPSWLPKQQLLLPVLSA